jgi:hypothetical protein
VKSFVKEKRMKKKIIIGIAILINILQLSSLRAGDLLYDIDFSSPLNQVGSQMTINSGGSVPFRTASESKFGEQIVMSQWGALNEQPAVLVPGKSGSLTLYGYSQIVLNMSQFNYQAYKINFDLCITQLNQGTWDGFDFMLDVPVTTPVSFENDGRILADFQYPVGRFSLNEKINVSVLVDLLKNTWSIQCNSNSYSGQFFYPYPVHPTLPTSINSIRFNLADDFGDNIVSGAAIDNIKVYGIPEPGKFLLVGIGGLLLRKRIKLDSRQRHAGMTLQWVGCKVE